MPVLMQATSFTLKQCDAISTKFRFLLKRKLTIASTIPNVAVEMHSTYNLVSLYNRYLQDSISMIHRNLNSHDLMGDIYRLRLSILQQYMWLPFSSTRLTSDQWFTWN